MEQQDNLETQSDIETVPREVPGHFFTRREMFK
jgi:hypothetical protein